MAATRLSFSYPEEMKEKLQNLAQKDNRSLSSYVQLILADHIDSNEVNIPKETKPTKKKKIKRTKKA